MNKIGLREMIRVNVLKIAIILVIAGFIFKPANSCVIRNYFLFLGAISFVPLIFSRKKTAKVLPSLLILISLAPIFLNYQGCLGYKAQVIE